MNRLLYGTGLALVGLYFGVACTSTVTGNEGNLDFTYTADDDVTNFNKPIAVGAKLELKVFETGSRATVEVTEAETDDPDVLDVETFSSNRVILVGIGEGETLVEVTATLADGSSVGDSVNMLATVPDTLELRHPCTQADGSATYLVGTDDVHINYEMRKGSGQPVIGFGYFPIETTGPLTLDEGSRDQTSFHFDIGDEPGTASIASTIDDSVLTLDITTEDAIDGAETLATSPREVRVDETIIIAVYPKVGDDRVCASNATMEVESLTPDICSVRANEPADAEEAGLLQRTGFVTVTGKAFGVCSFTASFPGGADTAEVDVEVEVGEFPDAE